MEVLKMDSKKQTVGGTGEWAVENFNLISGCSHGCKYCYACAGASRKKQRIASDWVNERPLKTKKTIKLYPGTLMIPSTHDITPQNISVVLPVIQELLNVGNALLIVSKPHLECVKTMCEQLKEYKNKILFRFTIGSPNSEVLKYWEPNAPSVEERIECLELAFNEGYQTSVSCEPMLDTIDNIKVLISRVMPSITNAMWIGKPNKLLGHLKNNGAINNSTLTRVRLFRDWYNDFTVNTLYNEFKDNPKIKWKESIKRVVGLEIPTEKGLDI